MHKYILGRLYSLLLTSRLLAVNVPDKLYIYSIDYLSVLILNDCKTRITKINGDSQ